MQDGCKQPPTPTISHKIGYKHKKSSYFLGKKIKRGRNYAQRKSKIVNLLAKRDNIENPITQ